MNSEKIRNWDSTQSWIPEAIHYPEDEEQIAGLIRRAVEDQKRIKAVGAALSWSDIMGDVRAEIALAMHILHERPPL